MKRKTNKTHLRSKIKKMFSPRETRKGLGTIKKNMQKGLGSIRGF